MCVYLAENLPYCTKLYPVTSCAAAGERTSVSDIFEWAISTFPRFIDGTLPTIVADSYYMDNAVFESLTANGVPFICSINPVRFPGHCAALRSQANHEFWTWSGIRNIDSNYLFLQVSDHMHGTKYLLTNCFRETSQRLPRHKIPVWDEYKFAASACDILNASMAGHYWPFRRTGWERGIDDLVFTVVLFDIYNLHIFLNDGYTQQGLCQTMQNFAFSLYAHALSL